MRYSFILLLICSLLGGCQSSPRKNFYLLNATPVEQSEQTAEITTLIGIGPVEVAEYLNRLHMVYEASDGSLVLADNDYWAEPLREGIPRIIGLNLTARDPHRGMVNFPWRRDSKPDYSLRLALHSLHRTGSDAYINATWELVDVNERNSLLRRHFIRRIPVASGARALAQAYSQLLAELSADMDQALIQHTQRRSD